MDITQASPNGQGWEWGLKNPTQTKDIFIKILQLAFRNSTFERTFEIKRTTFYYWTLCEKGEWFTFYSKLFFKIAKKRKEDVGKEQKNKAKEGWNKRKRRGRMEEEKQEIKGKRME